MGSNQTAITLQHHMLSPAPSLRAKVAESFRKKLALVTQKGLDALCFLRKFRFVG